MDHRRHPSQSDVRWGQVQSGGRADGEPDWYRRLQKHCEVCAARYGCVLWFESTVV